MQENKTNKLTLSPLDHTWILDLDGTILKHNGYKIDGYDSFLEGAEDFLNSIPSNDMVIFLTSRTEEYRKITTDFLMQHKVRFDTIICNAPYGERILINDRKPSGLNMALCVNTERDKIAKIELEIDNTL